ncbi:LLLL and CFNLAS motif-containing protein 1 isoform X2 [Rousettus aegyptiacus]|uniref:LLLL and CFNLAS motif-containing protein 1 isoform X2 n=1 Tax=Rousettus aegyptiacus TaxID=9407 RepID=UPI00168D6CDB|nr:LLLL and CFNLAS motif-containing protein 1 isoform X2 [Rousettus aegyptiacus]
MEGKGQTQCWAGLYRVAFLAAVLLLLWAKGVKPQEGSPGPDEGSFEVKTLSTDQEQEQYEEHFMASSVGEAWEVVDMAQPEDKTWENAAARGHLVDLAFCFNLAAVVAFL